MAVCSLLATSLLAVPTAAVPRASAVMEPASAAATAAASERAATTLPSRRRSPVAAWATQPAVRRLQDPASCAHYLSAAQIEEFEALVTDNTIVALGMNAATSLLEGQAALKSRGTCYETRVLTHDEWNYFHCLYPADIDGRSFFYVDGVMVGNGFTLNPGRLPHGMSYSAYQVDEMLAAAHATFTCGVPSLAESCHRGYRREGVGELTLMCAGNGR